MKRGGQFLLGLCFALLLLLGARTLVEGPDGEMESPVRPCPVCACLASEESAAPQTGTPLARADSLKSRFALREAERDRLPGLLPVRESNGWPVTGKSYVRTVYTAFPPEDMPG